MRAINNLYYRFYRLLISIGEAATPRYNAVLLLSIFAILNFITVAVLASIILNRIVIVGLPKIYLFLIGLLIIAVNSYLVFWKKKYLEIEQRYINESKGERRANTLVAGIYIVVTIAAFVLCLVYLNKHPIRHGGINY